MGSEEDTFRTFHMQTGPLANIKDPVGSVINLLIFVKNGKNDNINVHIWSFLLLFASGLFECLQSVSSHPQLNVISSDYRRDLYPPKK